MSYEDTLVKSDLSDRVATQCKIENLVIKKKHDDWIDMFNSTMMIDALAIDADYGILSASDRADLEARIEKDISTLTSFQGLRFTYSGTQGSFYFKLPVGNSVIIDWGDGLFQSYSGQGDFELLTQSYYSANGIYDIKIYGDYLNITHLDISEQTFIGDANDLVTLQQLTYLDISGSGFTGDAGRWSNLVFLTWVDCNSVSVTGSLWNWDDISGLTHLDVGGSDISGSAGNLANLALLTYLDLSDSKATGTLSDLNPLTLLTHLDVSGTLMNFNTQVTWDYSGLIFKADDCGWIAAQVDNCIISLYNGSTDRVAIDIDGTNEARTAASNTAHAALLADGCQIFTS